MAAGTDDFIITVKTDNTGTSATTQFTIPTTGSGYNYNVDCNNNGTDETTAQTGNYTCDYGTTGLNLGAGTYSIRISDNFGAGTGFPYIYFNNGGDKSKLISVDQWGTGKWTSMYRAFSGANNLTSVSSTDNPDLSLVTNINSMFYNATSFNADLSTWDVSSVTNMIYMFYNMALSTTNYDALLNGWNAQTLQSNVPLEVSGLTYCNAATARANMISSDNWTIPDGGKLSPPNLSTRHPIHK